MVTCSASGTCESFGCPTSLLTLGIVFLIFAILVGKKWYIMVLLICISVINNVEHKLLFLLALCSSPGLFFEESAQIFCLFGNFLVPRSILLCFRGSPCVWNTRPLSDTFPLSEFEVCVFILSMLTFEEHVFNVDEVQFILFSMISAFCVLRNFAFPCIFF